VANQISWTGYLGSVTTWMSSELNSLANSSTTTLAISSVGGTSGVFTPNSPPYLYADAEFVAGGTFSPTAGAFIEVWLLRTLDAGTNYEDGSASVAPGRVADFIINVRNGTTITPRAGVQGIILPQDKYKVLVRNQCGVALPSSGNIIRFFSYQLQVN
jgi:hypothetical protein